MCIHTRTEKKSQLLVLGTILWGTSSALTSPGEFRARSPAPASVWQRRC